MGEWRVVENPGNPRVAIVGDRYYSENQENWAEVVEVQPVPHVGGEDWRVQFRYHFPSFHSWGGMGFSLASPTVMHLISNDGCVFLVGHNVAYEGSLYSIYRPGGERVAFRRFSTVQICRAAISPHGDVCCYLTWPSGDPDYDSVLVALSCVDGSELYRFKVGNDRNVEQMSDIRSVSASGVQFDVDGFIVSVGTDGAVQNAEDYLAFRLQRALADEYCYSAFCVSEELPPDYALRTLRLALMKKGDDSTFARIYRRMGELSEDLGALKDAVGFYRRALSLDSKVGCKRLLASCEKRISK